MDDIAQIIAVKEEQNVSVWVFRKHEDARNAKKFDIECRDSNNVSEVADSIAEILQYIGLNADSCQDDEF